MRRGPWLLVTGLACGCAARPLELPEPSEAVTSDLGVADFKSAPVIDDLSVDLSLLPDLTAPADLSSPRRLQISTSGPQSCAVVAGAAKCWGNNQSGVLGNNSTQDSPVPVDVSGLSMGVTSISAGVGLTCALTVSGVKCWGNNTGGVLGDGTMTSRSVPVAVVGLPDGMRAVSAGWQVACALTAAGGVKCWGDNVLGALGDGTSKANSAVPVDVVGLSSGVVQIAAGLNMACVLTGQGAVKCWGSNLQGQLGNGSTSSSSLVPVDVVGLSSGVIAVSVAIDGNHVCAVTGTGGVKCWGANFVGELGDGTKTRSAIPVDVVGLGTSVVAVAAGDNTTCALAVGGGVKCWGQNTEGQLGNGTHDNSSVPIDVVGLGASAVELVAGSSIACVVLSDGTAQCWGNNVWGQLGSGSSGGSSAVPVTVRGL
jgi:alpha-tubulin suppressor-like RCC1 family protein